MRALETVEDRTRLTLTRLKITSPQVSEEIEGRVTKELSRDLIRTESRILGASSKLDEFFSKPTVRTSFVAVPGASRNNTSAERKNHWGSFLRRSLPQTGLLFSLFWSSE